jgi:hypothetical protein
MLFSVRIVEEEREEEKERLEELRVIRERQDRELKEEEAKRPNRKKRIRSCRASIPTLMLSKTSELKEWLSNIGIDPDEDLGEQHIWDFGFRTRNFAVAFKMDPQRAVELLFGYDAQRVEKTHPELYRQLMLVPKSAEPIDIENIVLGVIMSDPSIDPILAPERSTA